MGFPQNTNNTVCADPKIIKEIFEVNKDWDINSNSTIYNLTVDVTYWINVTKGHIRHVATRCKRFHLVPKRNTGVLNNSLVITKNKSLIAHINIEEKIYNFQQYLPLKEGIGICYQAEKGLGNIFLWLK